jgi:hypothetical protein
MPSLKDHLKKADYNEQFFHDTKDSYPDWALTGMFYSALHLVDAYLAKKNLSVPDHKTRTNYIHKISDLRSFYDDYRILYDYSVNARYKMHTFSEENINDTYKKIYLPFKKALIKIAN